MIWRKINKMTKEKAKEPQIRFKGFTNAWEQRKLGELANIVRGASPRPIQDPKWFDDESDVGWLRIADVTEQDGRIHHLEQHISKLGQEKTRVLTEPHLLLSIAATVGKPVVNYVKTGVHDGFLIFLEPKFNRVFMFQWLEMFRPKWQKYGQPGSQVNLNSDLVKNQEIALPREEEQQKIGAYFAKLDHLITLHQRKCDLLRKAKKTLLQKMFPKNGETTPEIRFKGFTGAWEQRKVGDLFNERNEQYPMSEEYPLMAFIANIGVAPKGERYDRSALVNDEVGKKYKRTEKGDFIYSSNNLETGSIGLNNYGKACISPVYSIFKSKHNADSDFLGRMLLRKEFINDMVKFRQGVVYGQWKIHEKDFLNLDISVPLLPEQQQIGRCFRGLDHLITLHQHELEKLQNIKKSCLKMMFV